MANNWTYGIYDPDSNQIKWGRSTNPFDRIKAFKSARPNCELLVVLPDHSVEFELHTLFDDKREEGEWFSVDAEMQAFIADARRWTPQLLSAELEPAPQPPVVETDDTEATEPTDPKSWRISPQLDLAVGVGLAAASCVMLVLTLLALYWQRWTLDLHTGRWIVSYIPMLIAGIYVVHRNAKRLGTQS